MGNKSHVSALVNTIRKYAPVNTIRKYGKPRPPCGQNSERVFKRKTINDFEIQGFPLALWGTDYFSDGGIFRSDRIAKILRDLNLGEKFFILEDPFSLERISLWIRKKSVMTVLNGAFSFKTYLLKEDMKLYTAPEAYYAKIIEDVYYFSCWEEYLGNGNGTRNFILFDNNKNQWDSGSVKSFLLNFSKELYALWKKENKTTGDLTAFDSVFLPDSVIKDLRQDFEDFLHSRKMYVEDLKLAYKRGYMLIGPPGNGKSLIIRTLCNYYGLDHFDIKRVIDNGGNLDMKTAIDCSIDSLLYPDEERPKVCILEDIDKFTAFQGGEADNKDYGAISLHSLLRGLDGVDSFNDIILIATSNFPDVLHEAIVGRPGRFDKIYKIDKPTEENIKKLLAYYKLTFDGCSSDFVSKSLLGSSMAFVAEFVKLAKMKYKRNNISVDEANKILDGIKAHQKLCETHFKEEKTVGFKR
jgi:hypothetical protein